MIKYFMYVRKSQDRSDRQIMSIEGQINEIKRLALDRGYEIVEVLIEQKSAKKPGRPVFNKMIERIHKGEANGILCWKLNRLARNPIDAGTISWLLQGNIIQAIHSKERSYLPTDNVLMMQIDFGIANQFINDLKGDVKRGMRDKANSGWCPQSQLPLGYLHHPDRQNSKEQIIKDKIRFPIVKELWERMESGAYTVNDIKRFADRLGLVNKHGKPYVLSTFYTMFKNPMYYGKFYWKDENDQLVLWQGKHPAMISEITFRKVQQIIRLRNCNSQPQKHEFTYRGLITCGNCNGHVTAERKLQVICTHCKNKFSILKNKTCRKCKTTLSEMNNPKVIDISYYRCTWKKDRTCRQKSISESKIDEQILNTLEKISIPDDVYAWAKQQVYEKAKGKSIDNGVLIESLRRKADRIRKKLKNLIDLRVSGEISKQESELIQSEYKSEIDKIENQIFQKENELEIALKENSTFINLAHKCAQKFKTGSPEQKKELTAYFCSNLTLLDKSLYFSTKKAPEVLALMQNMLFLSTHGSNLKIEHKNVDI